MNDAVATIRRFNRFFTQFVGALDTNFLDTGMSLAEARLLFEIAQHEACFADDLQAELDLDAGFVSRVLRRFENRGWISRQRIAADGRRRSIELTESGRIAFERLDGRQRREVETVLARLGEPRGRDLTEALETARRLLQNGTEGDFALRTFGPGDLGLIASRQSILYRDEYGWNDAIEVNEGEVTTAFLRNFKPGREQCWIAEVDGRMAGSIFLTDEGQNIARLRLLYVEPVFQGRGIANALVTACVGFARSVGYAQVTLWTQSILESARRIYARHGFRIVEAQEHTLFGPTLMGETWALDLDPPSDMARH